MASPWHGFSGVFDDVRYTPADFLVDPSKVFKNGDEDFESDGWKESLSQNGKLRLRATCTFGPSGFQGTISQVNPPFKKDRDDLWEASKPKGLWDQYHLLGFIQLPAEFDYTLQVFFLDGTFEEERGHQDVCTKTYEIFGDEFDSDLEPLEMLKAEWHLMFKEIFVEELGATGIEGEKWAFCPCESCTSEDSASICQSPGL